MSETDSVELLISSTINKSADMKACGNAAGMHSQKLVLKESPREFRPIFIDDLRDDSFIGQLKYKDVLAGLKNEAATLHSGCHEMDFEPLSAFDGL